MPDLLSAARMRALENAAIESGAVTGLELMERAGRGVVEAVFEEWPDLANAPHRAVVLCGPGNNGGDGFVVARLLKERGWEVEVFLYGNAEKLPPDARTNHVRWAEIGETRKLETPVLPQCDVVFDALFGTGLTRPIDDALLWEVLRLLDDAVDAAQIAAPGSPITRSVAIDLPSGLDTDSGEVLGGDPEHGLRAPCVMLCVTFHRMKLAHRRGRGAELCGRVVVKDIGL